MAITTSLVNTALVLLLFVFVSTAAQCLCSDSEWLFESELSNVTESDDNDTIPTSFDDQELAILDYRLPTTLVPIHYDLELQPYLHPNFNPNFTFDGKVTIWFKCKEETDQIIVHSRNLDVDNVQVILDDGGQGPNVINITTDIMRDFLIVELEENLTVNAEYGIEMSFSGGLRKFPFKDFVVAFYRTNNETRYLAVTQFEPLSARSAFPCFDEPKLKATFSVTVVRLYNMTSLSNMPLLESESRDEDWVADHFEKTPKMSTYLVAIAVSDFDYLEKQIGNITVRVWVRAEVINQTELALSTVEPLLNYMEEYVGIPYALPKLDIIGIPNVNYGAMENWGLVTFDEKNLLYSETGPNRPQSYYTVTTFLAHEIAHQWFGNLVTMEWWNDIWLNEGLSTYFADEMYTNVIKEHLEGFEFYFSYRFFEIAHMETDPRAHAVSLDYLTEDDIRTKIFTRITYVKGAIIIRMMEKFGGVKVLRNALKNYLQSNQYGNVNRNDLWNFISKELQKSKIENINVQEIMDTWVLQQGFPLVTVTRDYNTNVAYVRQRVFQDKKSYIDFNKTTKWAIPLMFTTKTMNTFDVEPKKWMYHEDFIQFTSSDGIPGQDEWVIFNPSMHGYYLVNYDNRNWKLLLNQLISDHTKLPVIIRMHLVQSLQLLKENDLIPHHLAYSVLEYIRKERNENILNIGLQAVIDLLRLFKTTQHYYLFRKYLAYVMLPIWKHVKLTTKPDSGPSYLQHITYRLSCTAGIKDCIDEVETKVYSLIYGNNEQQQNRQRIIDESTLCAVMRDATTEKWEELWTLRNNLSEALNYRSIVFKSFSCTENPYLLQKLLDIAMDKTFQDILPADRVTILINSIYNNFFSRQFVLKVFKDNLLDIAKWGNMDSLITPFFNTAITHQELEEIRSLLSCLPQKYVVGNEYKYRELMNKTQETIDNRINTIAINYNWLKRATENLPLIQHNEN